MTVHTKNTISNVASQEIKMGCWEGGGVYFNDVHIKDPNVSVERTSECFQVETGEDEDGPSLITATSAARTMSASCHLVSLLMCSHRELKLATPTVTMVCAYVKQIQCLGHGLRRKRQQQKAGECLIRAVFALLSVSLTGVPGWQS